MSVEREWTGFNRLLKGRLPWLLQFLHFGIVGLSNTAISYLTYAGLVWALSLNTLVSLQAANLTSFIISVANAYFWNSRWVFRSEVKEQNSPRQRRQTVAKFFFSYCSMYLLSVLLLFLWVSVLNVNKYIAPIFTLLITTPSNFLINKYWTFRMAK